MGHIFYFLIIWGFFIFVIKWELFSNYLGHFFRDLLGHIFILGILKMPGVSCKIPAFRRLLSMSLLWMYASLLLRRSDSRIAPSSFPGKVLPPSWWLDVPSQP